MAKETPDKDILRLRSELEKQLGWESAAEWHSSMFTELSEKIFDKSQVMLSTATLKRFYGVVNHEGAPSINTLDTLAIFAGYENWRSFKQAKSHKKRIKFPKHIPGKTLYVTAGFFIALFMVLVISNKRANDPSVINAITFLSRPVTNTYPNSVVFDFDLGQIRSDSIIIQQYWDRTKTIKIDRDQKQATGIYYFPGYFRAKLLIDGQAVKEHDLFLRSDSWIGTLDYSPVPKYFSPVEESQASLQSPPELESEVKSLEEPIKTTFHYITDLGNISGDDFSLDATAKIKWADKWAVCQSLEIYVIGTDGAMIIPFSKIGCSSNSGLMLNDVYLNGKKTDLSALSADLSAFTNLGLTVKQKNVHVFINGNDVYEAAYHNTMGRIVGLRFKFLGVGEVQSLSLKDGSGEAFLEM